MKRILILFFCVIMLSGCTNANYPERALTFRQKLLSANGCSFDAVITADYADVIYTFTLRCTSDKSGDVLFVVTQPDSISGIKGIITEQDGKLTFDDKALMFSKIADGQITPVSAPWVLIHTLRSGYIRSYTDNGSGAMLVIDDSYEEDPLQLDIWLDGGDIPTDAEILWRGRRIVSLRIENFTML